MAQKNSRFFSFVGQNIKKIRQAKHISQSDFAALFELSRPSVGAYEEGRSEPKIETLIQISRHFNISIDVLLTKELGSKDIYSLGLLNKKLDQAHEVKPIKEQWSYAPFVGHNERVNFLVNRMDKTYLQNLPKIGLAKHQNIDLILQQEGTKLEVDNKGIRHGDQLFCRRENTFTDEPDKLWVCVCNHEIFVGRIRRIVDNTIELSYDNPIHEDTSIKLEDIEESYLVQGVYSEVLTKPNSLEGRLKAIEEKLNIT